MHSRVIELSVSPLKKEEFADEYALPEWFCGYIADYTDLITREEEREDSISWVASFLGASYKNGRMVITKESCIGFLTFRFNEFKRAVDALKDIKDFEGFLGYETGYRLYLLKNSYDDEYGFWIYDGGDFLTADRFMRSALLAMEEDKKDELIYYTGSVWDYHM